MDRTQRHRADGFSLLEVLIAVVVLASGLLALAALQGTLARNATDAKVRTRVVALLQSELEVQRATPFADIASRSAPLVAHHPQCTDTVGLNAVERTACDAGLSTLALTRTVTAYGASGTTFQAGVPAGLQAPGFKHVLVTGAWTDAFGQSRSAQLRTVFSPLALAVNSAPRDTGLAAPMRAIVRQSVPAIAGMVPIALGNGDTVLASTPMPVHPGGHVIGTRFDVVTYTASATTAAIQQRVETEVIKCRCQFGAGSQLEGPHRIAQWPAIWTGTHYALYQRGGNVAAPGQRYAAGPRPGVAQSPSCRECCRDRHDDPASSQHAKFAPHVVGAPYAKYDLDDSQQLVAATDTTSGTYVDSCRMIRVDGLWRTAADLQARHLGLLATDAAARTPIPADTAIAAYTTFLQDYLAQYNGTDADAPGNAAAMFGAPARGLNQPAVIAIPAPSTTDIRHLHARGLYVDHLEHQARDTLAKALADGRNRGQCNGAALAGCVLPFLPFATLDLTGIAQWTASDPEVLRVRSADPGAHAPTGGRVHGLAPGAAAAIATIRRSNSGIALDSAIPGAIDALGDASTLHDAQAFTVGGVPGGLTHPGQQPKIRAPPE